MFERHKYYLMSERRKRVKFFSYLQPCVVHGKPIQPGATFYMGCAGLCTCGSGDSFSCVPLCAPQNYACAPGTEAKVEDMVIDTGSRECTCPSKRIKIWLHSFFYKNIIYKNIEAQICEIVRTFLE